MAYSDWPYSASRSARSIAAAIFSFLDVLTALAFSAWRFIDIPSHVSLAMDGMARAFGVIAAKTAAFRAFVTRALDHNDYTAGHFDPCRMPA